MQERYKKLSLDGWERKRIFEQFKDCDFPFLVVGANLNLGKSITFWKTHQTPVYLACVYVACRAVNEIPAFRQRIRGDDLIEHEAIHADFTVPQGLEAFTFKRVAFNPDFKAFCKSADATAVAKNFVFTNKGLVDDHWLFMSCHPWTAFTHIMRPIMSFKKDNIPRISWGKFSKVGRQWQMPVSIQAHHSLVDGLHMAKLIERMENLFSDPKKTFGG